MTSAIAMDTKKTIHYWIEGAKSDRQTADVLFRAKQNPQCLFWCHLLLEKLLKAHVVKTKQSQAPYTHNLVLLAGEAGLSLSDEQKEWLAEISEFNVLGRYSDELADFTRKCTPEFTEKYYSITQTLFQWLLQRISSP